MAPPQAGWPGWKRSISIWYEAFAFCAWDGARLPTEIEWEYAAAGGGQDRDFPWGNTEPTPDFAIYGCLGAGTSSCSFEDILPVGSRPNGDARFGQRDLAGSVDEWVLDWFELYPEEMGMDHVNLEEADARAVRGGAWTESPSNLNGHDRRYDLPTDRTRRIGLRCARNP